MSVSIGEVAMSITVGQWVKCPCHFMHASPCQPQVVCLSLSGMLVSGMLVECVRLNACGTKMPVERVGWNASETEMPMECVVLNTHGT